LAEHVRARTRAGTELRLRVSDARLAPARDDVELIATGELAADETADLRWIELQSDLIVHRVVSHNIYVFVRRDLQRGMVGPEPELLDMLHWQKSTLVIEREDANVWRGLAASFALGAQHIATGSDHLMFMLMLLLPAPLRANAGRWRELGPRRQSTWLVVTRVTAFSLGHALTLTAGALRGLALPAQLVETAIAASVIISALHALRPLVAGGEAYLAGAFGLVHGLGFASALREFGFDAGSLTLALLGFNLGIEAIQVGIIMLVAPLLLLAAANYARTYTQLRSLGALLGIAFGMYWIVERLAS
jgi:hypothetical protein